MSIPNVNVQFRDGGLGIVPPGPGGAQAKIGVSLSGTPLTVVAIGNTRTCETILQDGPLCDAVAQVTGVAGTTVYAVPCPIVTAGLVTATLSQVGSGAGVVSAASAVHQEVLIKISTGGTVGAAAFQASVNGGAYSSPVTTSGTTYTYRVPGTFLVLTFGAGTYRLNDVYTFPVTGVNTRTSGAPDVVTTSVSPVDAYQLEVTVVKAGARGTAQFTYSLDGGAVVSAPILTAASYVIPGSGIVLSFSDAAYVLSDVYTGTATPPATDNTNIGLALDALKATAYAFEGTHVVGAPSSAANAVTLATAVDSKMTAAKLAKRYQFALVECPTTEVDATVAAAWTNFVSTEGRIVACAGDVDLVSPLTGLTLRRNLAWVASARIANSKLSESMAKVALGSIPNVRNLYRDEEATPGLDDVRLVTMRTIQGTPGFYITRGQTMALVTSDYNRLERVRVADRAATIANAAYTKYLESDVRIDAQSGFIDPRDAGAMDNDVSGQLRAALMGSPGSSNDEVSNIKATVARDQNLLSVPEIAATVSIVPKQSVEWIDVGIGFVNPALQG